MNTKANITEFKRLGREIEQSEADVEAKKWRQAELAAQAIAAGMTQRGYAAEVGTGKTRVGTLVAIWNRWGVHARGQRPRFKDAYETAKTGSEDLVTRADTRSRQEERREPTRHDDRVEMAASLMTDPEVAKAVLATPAARHVQQAVYRQDAEDREQVRQSRQRAAQAGALPLPGHI